MNTTINSMSVGVGALRVALIVGVILLLPLYLTVTGNGVDGVGFHWTLEDFVFAFMVMFSVGFAYTLVSRIASNNGMYKAASALALLGAFFLIWINAAVGIIGDGPVNAMYLAVLVVGFLGACAAGFKARGMSIAMFASAITMMAVPVIALMINEPDYSPGVLSVFVINAGFATVFTGAGLLYRHAAK